jgi:hypothetical protein
MPSSAAATNGAAVPRTPSRKAFAAAYSEMRSRGAMCTMFVNAVSSPLATAMPMTAATGMSAQMPGATR